MPSSTAGKKIVHFLNLVKRLSSDNGDKFSDGSDMLVRVESVCKAAYGGERSIDVHMKSIKTSCEVEREKKQQQQQAEQEQEQKEKQEDKGRNRKRSKRKSKRRNRRRSKRKSRKRNRGKSRKIR